jgi:hypothetical protein
MTVITQILAAVALAASIAAGAMWWRYDNAVADNAMLEHNNSRLVAAAERTAIVMAEIKRVADIRAELLSMAIKDRERIATAKARVIRTVETIEVPADAPDNEKCINLDVHPVADTELRGLFNAREGDNGSGGGVPVSP